MTRTEYFPEAFDFWEFANLTDALQAAAVVGGGKEIVPIEVGETFRVVLAPQHGC